MILHALAFLMLGASAQTSHTWGKLPPLPDREGFAAPFAGTSHGTLLVSGGANFPEKRPWEGGTKIWVDTIFALDRPDGEWRIAGKLPRPLGYGVTATYRNRVICVGGSDANAHYAEAFGLEWISGKLVTTRLPSLPIPLANGCGTLVGNRFYVAGGQERPDSTTASTRVFSLDLAARGATWREEPPLPGDGRILSTAASFDNSFWVVGGASLRADASGKPVRTYLRESLRFDGRKWQRMPDLPKPIVAAPSPAPSTKDGFLILGGDDGSLVGTDPATHPGFPATILRFDGRTWMQTGRSPASRVTVPTVQWQTQGGIWVIPSGEQRPGVRSPDVWSLLIAQGSR